MFCYLTKYTLSFTAGLTSEIIGDLPIVPGNHKFMTKFHSGTLRITDPLRLMSRFSIITWTSVSTRLKLYSKPLTLFQPGRGVGGIHSLQRFPSPSPQISIDRLQTFWFLNFTIETPSDKKIKFITCQGVTWSLFCQKHFVSPHIFHCIYIELSSSIFSDIYIYC